VDQPSELGSQRIGFPKGIRWPDLGGDALLFDRCHTRFFRHPWQRAHVRTVEIMGVTGKLKGAPLAPKWFCHASSLFLVFGAGVIGYVHDQAKEPDENGPEYC
jgi:hypothetical protein